MLTSLIFASALAQTADTASCDPAVYASPQTVDFTAANPQDIGSDSDPDIAFRFYYQLDECRIEAMCDAIDAGATPQVTVNWNEWLFAVPSAGLFGYDWKAQLYHVRPGVFAHTGPYNEAQPRWSGDTDVDRDVSTTLSVPTGPLCDGTAQSGDRIRLGFEGQYVDAPVVTTAAGLITFITSIGGPSVTLPSAHVQLTY